MYTCGIDIGSVSTEIVIIKSKDGNKNNFEICSYVIGRTGSDIKRASEELFNESLALAKLKKENIKNIVATGYGRKNVKLAHRDITEITCHASGVLSVFPDVKTIIDIGGQDSKVIKIDELTKKPMDFLMNDKCAAGTGRFLEVMAKALDIELKSFGDIFEETNESIEITSTCTVFAESEIVSLIGQGIEKKKIVKGLLYSVADRIISMVSRLGLEEPVALTGGVAKNKGIAGALEEKLKIELQIPFEPQITGALGAAALALRL